MRAGSKPRAQRLEELTRALSEPNKSADQLSPPSLSSPKESTTWHNRVFPTARPFIAAAAKPSERGAPLSAVRGQTPHGESIHQALDAMAISQSPRHVKENTFVEDQHLKRLKRGRSLSRDGTASPQSITPRSLSLGQQNMFTTANYRRHSGGGESTFDTPPMTPKDGRHVTFDPTSRYPECTLKFCFVTLL